MVVVGISCLRNQGESDDFRPRRATSHRDVPMWLKNATADYIRPIMGEQSLLMRLFDERVFNEDDKDAGDCVVHIDHSERNLHVQKWRRCSVDTGRIGSSDVLRTRVF